MVNPHFRLLACCKWNNCICFLLKNVKKHFLQKQAIDNIIIINLFQINANDPLKVQGEWCKGYSASCKFKKESSDNNSRASLADLEGFLKNVNAIVEETIQVLKKELVPIS